MAAKILRLVHKSGVELRSEDHISKNSYWKIIEDDAGADSGLYVISSAQKTK